MLVCLRLAYRFGRRPVVFQPSYEQIIQSKLDRFSKYTRRYSSDHKFEHQDILYQQFVYGHSCHIAGVTTNNFHSQKFTKSVMEYAKPNLLILGGLSDSWTRLYQRLMKMKKRYQHPIIRAQKMMCKQRLSKILQERILKDKDFIWDDKKKEISIINHRDRVIQPDDYLTVGQMATENDHTKLAFGRPSEIFIFEDLMLRYSVDDLKGILERAVSKVMEKQGNSNAWRRSLSLQAIRNFVMSEQPEIHSREMTYQAALLKRYAKLQNNILLVTPGHFVERIAQQVHQVNMQPDKVYRQWLDDKNSQTYSLFQQAMAGDVQVLLQKFALLCVLKQNCIQSQFYTGTNVFKSMCFGSLFEEMSISQLHQRYYRAKDSTEDKWFQLMQHRIKNVQIEAKGQIRLTLQQQFQLQHKRAELDFPYTYQPKNYLSQYENKVKLVQLQAKMREMLNQQDDKHQIELFDKFTKGFRSRQGIILYSKLLGKANVQSYDRLKLPVFHYQAFRGIYKEYLRQFLLKGVQNSKIEDSIKKRMKKMQGIMQEHMRKIDDPTELRKYLTGQKGRVLNVSMNQEQGPKIDEEDIKHLKNVFGQMTAEDQQEMEHQFGKDWNKVE